VLGRVNKTPWPVSCLTTCPECEQSLLSALDVDFHILGPELLSLPETTGVY
jgi:hypothetical protein